MFGKAAPKLFACWITAMCLLMSAVPSLSATPEPAGTQAVSAVGNNAGKLRCENSRAQFAALTCERKADAMPTSTASLDIPYYYSTSLLWQDSLLNFAQELYSDQPKDLRSSTSTAIQSCLDRCARVKQCQDQLIEYFGLSTSFFSGLSSFLSEKKKDSRRNESLATALGESLYKSDAGELINRHTDIKICGELKARAKKDQCDLSAGPKK